MSLFPGGCGRKRHLGRLWAVTIEGRTHPWEDDKDRKGPGAEGLIDSQCRGFSTGKYSVPGTGSGTGGVRAGTALGGLMVAL